MPLRALSHFLDSSNAPYRSYNHAPTYTAQDTAHQIHQSGYEVAKSVLLKADGRLVLAVLPACERIDLNRFCALAGVKHVQLASEDEMVLVAPLCDTGSIPPVGNLFGLPVYVATSLTRDEVIAFNAGNHTEEVRMFYRHFEELVQPRVMDFSFRPWES